MNVFIYVRTWTCIRPIYSCICKVKRHSHTHTVSMTPTAGRSVPVHSSVSPQICIVLLNFLSCCCVVFSLLLCCCCCVVVFVTLCRVAFLCFVLLFLLCCVVSHCVASRCFVLLSVVLCCLPHRGRRTALGSVCFFSAPDCELFSDILKDECSTGLHT